MVGAPPLGPLTQLKPTLSTATFTANQILPGHGRRQRRFSLTVSPFCPFPRVPSGSKSRTLRVRVKSARVNTACNCFRKQRPLSVELFVTAPDGWPGPLPGSVTGKKSKSRLSDICVACHSEISADKPGCTALDQIFHVACFKCCRCSKVLAGSSFYNIESEPICEGCYQVSPSPSPESYASVSLYPKCHFMAMAHRATFKPTKRPFPLFLSPSGNNKF